MRVSEPTIVVVSFVFITAVAIYGLWMAWFYAW